MAKIDLYMNKEELHKQFQEWHDEQHKPEPEPVPRRSPTLNDLLIVYHEANNTMRGLQDVQHHILTELRKQMQERINAPSNYNFGVIEEWIKENE